MGWELITPDSLAELDSSQNTKLGGISTEANKTTFPTNTTEGQFSFNIDGVTTTNDVFSSAERTKLNRLRAGQAPDDASVSIKNNAITISKNGTAIRLNNAGGFGDITFSNSDVGLGNVSNNAQVRQDLVGAPNAIKNSQITTNANGTLNNAGGGTAPNINNIADSGTTKSGAARANAAIDSSNRITANIFDGTNTISPANVYSGATRANSAIDSSNRVVGNLYFSGGTARSISDVLGARDRAYAAIDSSNRITANIFDGTNSISPANVYSGATRANAGLSSTGDVNRSVPQAQLGNVNTYSVDYQVVTWSRISNAGYTPSSTSQTINITWKRASDGATVCTSRWVPTINTTSNTINSVTPTANVTGSGCSASSQSGAGTAFSTVTFTRGGVSVTVTAKINVLSGFTFKSGG